MSYMIVLGALRHTLCLKVHEEIDEQPPTPTLPPLRAIVPSHPYQQMSGAIEADKIDQVTLCRWGPRCIGGNGLCVDGFLWRLGGVGLYVGEVLGILAVAVCMSAGSLASWCWW